MHRTIMSTQAFEARRNEEPLHVLQRKLIWVEDVAQSSSIISEHVSH